jgi:hypothetical protein
MKLFREDCLFNLPKIVKGKYDRTVGHKISQLHENLMEIWDKTLKKPYSSTRNFRPTVHKAT